MSDAQTLKKLCNQFGTEVANVQTTFAVAASKAEAVRNQFTTLLGDRNIPDAEIQKFANEDKQYQTITKTIGRGDQATSAVRIEAYGNDLLVEVRHYEVSAKAKSNRSCLGTALTVGGLLFIWTGVGVFVFLAGLGILFLKPQFPDPSAERDASKLLFETVMETLMAALTNCDVDAGAQIETDF